MIFHSEFVKSEKNEMKFKAKAFDMINVDSIECKKKIFSKRSSLRRKKCLLPSSFGAGCFYNAKQIK